MRHFGHLSDERRKELFFEEPAHFTRDDASPVLAAALGATLYAPATRPTLAADVRKQAARSAVSMVLCLEDAIADDDVPEAEENLVRQVRALWEDPAAGDGPLLFVRVRAAGQITDLVRRLGPAVRRLTGFVLPKFTGDRAPAFLGALAQAEAESGCRLLAMPVLESPELAHLETRRAVLDGIAAALAPHRRRILALRLGVTDLCSAYGLRRSPDFTAYDIQMVAGVIGDVVNMFCRETPGGDDDRFTVTGPVWEYFPVAERMFKPQLRRSPFAQSRPDAEELRTEIIRHDLDGLIREIQLDRANGLLGKTVIHPSHLGPVHALSVVTHEEYSDAADILGPARDGGGVLRSAYTNKMNEVKPHRAWARQTMKRARIFGVAREDVTFVELLGAFQPG